MSTSEKKIAVIGGGLSGLAAAYTLSQKGFSVSVFEAESTCGGRVQSLPVHDRQVDFGGFIIYPWYETFHRLIDGLGIQDHLRPIPLKQIYYDIEGDGRYQAQRDIDFPIKDTLRLYPRLALGVIPQNDLAKPDLEQFAGRTISEQFRHILGTQTESLYERFTDIVCQGYCYGPVDQYKMAFVAPIIRFQRLYGDIEKAFYFSNGTSVFTNALVRAIEDAGGAVHTNTSIETVHEKEIQTQQGAVHTVDQIVFALPADDPLYRQVLPSVDAGCAYTHFYTVTLKTQQTPVVGSDVHWGATFHRPKDEMPYQVLSAINLSELYGNSLDGYVNVNVICREPASKKTVSAQELFEILLPELKSLFPGAVWAGAVQMRHWTRAMPIAQEAFVQKVQEGQGENGHAFAGDFLGSPSMETALLTGVRAAEHVIAQDR